MADENGGTQGLDPDDDFGSEVEDEEEPSVVYWGRLVPCDSNLLSEITLVEDRQYTIGRNPDCDSVISDCNVISGVHCAIFTLSGSVFIEDRSTNGTFVNGNLLGKMKKSILTSGSKVTICKKNSKRKIEERSFFFFDVSEEQKGGIYEQYMLKETLGSGAFATVRKAVRKDTGEQFAVKIISKKKFCRSEERQNSLEDEVKILQKINHNGVVKIYETFDTDDELFLVLELVTGGELFDLINEKQLFNEHEARALFKQMVEVIRDLHEQGIVHRDLKFENILLKDEKKDIIKISDFGLSRIIGEGSFMQTICGTPEYLAPEVLTKAKTSGYGNVVDIWSLGVILYTMLCGYRPFEATPNGKSVFDKITEAKFDYPDDVTLTKEAIDLINKMLTKEPSKRITAKDAANHPWVTGTPQSPLRKRSREESFSQNSDDDKVHKTRKLSDK